jgi:hypothetical protein
MPTELQLLQRRAKYLGLKATGSREDLLRRISRSEGISREAVLQIIKRDLAKMKPKAKAYDYDYRYNRRGLSEEDELIMSYCGNQCFAGGRAICPPCDSRKCYCEPKCSSVRDMISKGVERERMKNYAEILGCIKFRVGDIVVNEEAKQSPFGIVDKVLDDDNSILITQLAYKDSELQDVIDRAKREGYRFTAEEILDFDTKYAVRPIWKELKRSQTKVKADQYELYDENKLYFKGYTMKEIRELIKRN